LFITEGVLWWPSIIKHFYGAKTNCYF